MKDNKMTKAKIYMIGGIVTLVLAIAGSAYAYYQATATATISGSTATPNLSLTVRKISNSNDNLIPITKSSEMLTKAALGEGNTGAFDASKACLDMYGRTACQVYEITLKNTGDTPLKVNGGVTLNKGNATNLDCALMASNISVTNTNTCVGTDTITKNEDINVNQTKTYYIMLYINNKTNEVQYDTGNFSGIITFSSASGKVEAEFGADTLTAAQYLSSLSELVSDGNGNKRYRGATPDNYIDIGERSGSTPVLWRIIGVFKDIETCDNDECTTTTPKDLVKIIRNESVGNKYWNESGTNDWSNATLQTYLNGTYLNSLKQYVSESKIAKVKWNLGGFSSTSMTPSEAYTAERGNVGANNSTTLLTWPGKIALAYPSDYVYASTCNKTLNQYNDSSCISTNWIRPLLVPSYGWLLTPLSSNSLYAWRVFTAGRLSGGSVDDGGGGGAFPVLYLSADAVVESGTVSGINAYILS